MIAMCLSSPSGNLPLLLALDFREMPQARLLPTGLRHESNKPVSWAAGGVSSAWEML